MTERELVSRDGRTGTSPVFVRHPASLDQRSPRRSTLARGLQYRMAEKRGLRSSWALPESAPLARSRDGAKQRRNHGARKRPVSGQGEMQLRSGTCLEREQADERPFFIEQTAAARSRIERGRGADHLAAIVSVEPFHDSLANGEIAAAGKADGDNVFAGTQRLRSANRHGRQIQIGHANQAEVVRQAAGLYRSDPVFGAMRDFDDLGFACDVAGGRQEVSGDDHPGAEALGTVGGDRPDLDQAVREVVRAQVSRRYARRRGDEPQQRNKRSRETLELGHEHGDSRKRATGLLHRLGTQDLSISYCSARHMAVACARPRSVRQPSRKADAAPEKGECVIAALLGGMGVSPRSAGRRRRIRRCSMPGL